VRLRGTFAPFSAEDLAARYPVIPAFQIVADGRYRRLGVQVGWTWIVTYFGAFVSVDDLFD
jgi:hypothetical protein